MFGNFKSKLAMLAALGAGTLVSSVSMAAATAAIDVTDAVGTITNQVTSVGALAGAGLAVAIIIVAWRWVKRAAN